MEGNGIILEWSWRKKGTGPCKMDAQIYEWNYFWNFNRGENHSVASYYYSILDPEIKDSIVSEKDKEKIEESENFIQSIETFTAGFIYFFVFNKFVRHYVPFIRGKVNNLLKNKDFLFDKLYNIIKERRIEIENTPRPLRHDMLTSFILQILLVISIMPMTIY